jgi:hypothetical protein
LRNRPNERENLDAAAINRHGAIAQNTNCVGHFCSSSAKDGDGSSVAAHGG